jgi:hypothetical protein
MQAVPTEAPIAPRFPALALIQINTAIFGKNANGPLQRLQSRIFE